MRRRLMFIAGGVLWACGMATAGTAEEQVPDHQEAVLTHRLQHLLQAVETLGQSGQADLAAQVADRAETVRLERDRLRQYRAALREPAKQPDPRTQSVAQWHVELLHHLTEMRTEIHGLREEVAQLRRELDTGLQHERDARYRNIDLSGRWLMILPAGYQYETRIASRGAGRYQVEVPGNLAGLYRHQGSRLAVEEPRDKRLTEFVWEFRNEDFLLLTAAPPTAKVGADYRGAVLRRMPVELSAPAELKTDQQGVDEAEAEES